MAPAPLRQEGARIRGAIDWRWVFDVVDDPLRNTGPVHNTGRIALREMYRTRMRFRDLRVRTRDPGLEIVSSSDSANLSRNP